MAHSLTPATRTGDPAAFQALLGTSAPLRVTVQLPMRAFPDAGQNLVRARRAADLARKQLDAWSGPVPERACLDEHLRGLEDIASLPTHPIGSLVALIDATDVRVVSLAEELMPRVSVGRCFALRPLLQARARDVAYRALCISTRRISLFEGDARGLERVSWLVSGLEQPVHRVRTEAKLREIARFHHHLGRAMSRRFAGDPTPLVLVTDLAHQAGLRAEVRLPGLLAEGVMESPDQLSAAEVHGRAWPLLVAELGRRKRAALAAYDFARNAGKVVDLVDDVALAVTTGCVHRLWLDAEFGMPGLVDPSSGRVVAPEGDDDVLDSMAEIVLAQGGEVHVVDAPMLPSVTGVAAELH
jgi:hypothetical protein